MIGLETLMIIFWLCIFVLILLLTLYHGQEKQIEKLKNENGQLKLDLKLIKEELRSKQNKTYTKDQLISIVNGSL